MNNSESTIRVEFGLNVKHQHPASLFVSYAMLARKTLNNNDLHQVQTAVLDLTRGLSPQNALEDHQNGGDIASSVVCFDLP